MTVEIIDNFLNEQEYKALHDLVISYSFPWFFAGHKVHEGDGILNLQHIFYGGVNTVSPFFYLLEPFAKKLKVIAPILIKANCTFGQPNKIQTNFHIDGSMFDTTNRKTAIFYLSDTNGQTVFKKDNKKIECKQNRLVKFDSHLEHAGEIHKGEFNTRRIVINFNYF